MSADPPIVIVSTNEARWLEPCLRTVFAHAGDASLDVVVDNESADGIRELVERDSPAARVGHSANHGFGHANNRGAFACDARYVLFLNPDTEIACDWTLGSFMLCRRDRQLPSMTIIHDAGKGGVRPSMVAQDAYTRTQYAREHFGPATRAACLRDVGLRYAIGAAVPGRDPEAPDRRAAGRMALRTMTGRAQPPFGAAPPRTLAPDAATLAAHVERTIEGVTA